MYIECVSLCIDGSGSFQLNQASWKKLFFVFVCNCTIWCYEEKQTCHLYLLYI